MCRCPHERLPRDRNRLANSTPPARRLFSKAITASAYMVSTPERKQRRFGSEAAEESGTRLAAALHIPNMTALRAVDAWALADAAPGGRLCAMTLQYVYCPRGEKCDCRQRYGRLNHHQGLSPARENRNIGRRKSSAGVKGEKQVVDKPGSPLILSHFLAKVGIQYHLRE